MRKLLAIVMLLMCDGLVGMAGAANYMYEKASVKGVGYLKQRRSSPPRPALVARS